MGGSPGSFEHREEKGTSIFGGADPYRTQGLTPVVPFTRWAEKVPPPPGRADAPLLCSVSPYPPHIRPLGHRVPAEPLSCLYKGRMTLAKGLIARGRFSSPQC